MIFTIHSITRPTLLMIPVDKSKFQTREQKQPIVKVPEKTKPIKLGHQTHPDLLTPSRCSTSRTSP